MGSVLHFYKPPTNDYFCFFTNDSPELALYSLLSNGYRAMIFTTPMKNIEECCKSNYCIIVEFANLYDIGIQTASNISNIIKYNSRFKENCKDVKFDIEYFIKEKESYYKNNNREDISKVYNKIKSTFIVNTYSQDEQILNFGSEIIAEFINNNNFITDVLGIYELYTRFDFSSNKNEFIDNLLVAINDYYDYIAYPVEEYLDQIQSMINIIKIIKKFKNNRKKLIRLIDEYITIKIPFEFDKSEEEE